MVPAVVSFVEIELHHSGFALQLEAIKLAESSVALTRFGRVAEAYGILVRVVLHRHAVIHKACTRRKEPHRSTISEPRLKLQESLLKSPRLLCLGFFGAYAFFHLGDFISRSYLYEGI